MFGSGIYLGWVSIMMIIIMIFQGSLVHFRNPKVLSLGNIFFLPVIARTWAEMGGWVRDDTWKSLKKIEFCMDLSSVPLKVLRVSTQNGHLLC